jgi:hypothetical protein
MLVHCGKCGHNPRNSCVRFVFGVTAASRNTSPPGGLLGLTWTGLAPADRASFAGAFRYSITLSARSSTALATFANVRTFILNEPEHIQERNSWQRAAVGRCQLSGRKLRRVQAIRRVL